MWNCRHTREHRHREGKQELGCRLMKGLSRLVLDTAPRAAIALKEVVPGTASSTCAMSSRAEMTEDRIASSFVRNGPATAPKRRTASHAQSDAAESKIRQRMMKYIKYQQKYRPACKSCPSEQHSWMNCRSLVSVVKEKTRARNSKSVFLDFACTCPIISGFYRATAIPDEPLIKFDKNFFELWSDSQKKAGNMPPNLTVFLCTLSR